MSKKNLIFLIVIISVLFLLGLVFFYNLFFPIPKEGSPYLKNTSELYSLFTDYMKEEVDYQLQLLSCQPQEYYYNNSAFCFLCEEVDACFGFVWVVRAGGERMMNPGHFYLTNYDKLSVKVADFYKDGLASLFQCQEESDPFLLQCKDNIIFIEEYKDVKMVLANEEKLEDVSKKICNYFDNPLPDCQEQICSCGSKEIIFTKEQLFIYNTASENY